MTEILVLWDEGGKSWEMGEDCKKLPNMGGDAFLTMCNGFGKRRDEVSPPDPIKQFRDHVAGNTDAELTIKRAFGLMPEAKRKTPTSRDKQLTRDIHHAVLHGAPVKGGANGRSVDPRRVGLAKQAATGEPMLVRKGPLKVRCTIRPFTTPLGWAAKGTHTALKKRIRRHSKW